MEHCSEGLPCFIFILLCPVFCRCRAACRKSCLRTGPLAPFAAHGGLRRPLRSAHASALALRGRLRAKSRAFSAGARKGGFAPFRHAPAGAITTPFWRHSPRGLHFTAQRCKALPPPSFPRTLLLLLYLFQQSVPQMRISIGFLSPSKISEHNKIRFFNWQSAAFYFIVLQQFTSLCLTGDHQNTAIVPLVVAGA